MLNSSVTITAITYELQHSLQVRGDEWRESISFCETFCLWVHYHLLMHEMMMLWIFYYSRYLHFYIFLNTIKITIRQSNLGEIDEWIDRQTTVRVRSETLEITMKLYTQTWPKIDIKHTYYDKNVPILISIHNIYSIFSI